MLVRKATECCKLSLMEDSGQSSEDQNAESNEAARKDQAQGVSSGRRTPLAAGLQTVCYTLAENLPTFCLFPKALWETEIKVGGQEQAGQAHCLGHSPHWCTAQGKILLSGSVPSLGRFQPPLQKPQI